MMTLLFGDGPNFIGERQGSRKAIEVKTAAQTFAPILFQNFPLRYLQEQSGHVRFGNLRRIQSASLATHVSDTVVWNGHLSFLFFCDRVRGQSC